jgi:hypothetical protein
MAIKKKPVNIEKYDFEEFEKEQKPFTMILTQVIQKSTKNIKETYLWIYLQSLPITWKINKKHLMEVFDISSRTYERYMSWLNAVNLIEYRQIRTDQGAFGTGKLIVLNGTKFNEHAVYSRTAKIGGTVVNRTKKVQSAHAHRSAILPLNGETERSVCDAYIKTTVKKDNNVIKKTKPVFVFSCSQEIKDFIESCATHRDISVNEDLINQVMFWLEQDNNQETIPKRINTSLSLISKKKWNIPHGYKGITSQSIKQKEEEQQRQKEDETKYDALIGDKLFNSLETARTDEECNEGRKQCESLFAMLRGSNANRATM